MAKAEALYNAQNSAGTAFIISGIAKSSPGGSGFNKVIAQNSNKATEAAGEVAENIGSAADSLASWIINNWKVAAVAVVAVLVLIKKI